MGRHALHPCPCASGCPRDNARAWPGTASSEPCAQGPVAQDHQSKAPGNRRKRLPGKARRGPAQRLQMLRELIRAARVCPGLGDL
ncbi:hypothetical protein CFBP6109_P100147 (plasmid) [Pseudomonas syringae pv. cerasicola]|nr:hypothetical protein CFBP6109_P100119 [Pseudomonas syringae pv. cerasicola]SOS31158.1 hypothetical protein CFBP6109_P100147 [Pseudomonas syringae pv. cerasicola]